jgi:hypothetical protein
MSGLCEKDQEILGAIFAFYKHTLDAVQQVTSLNLDSKPEEWNSAFSNENSAALMEVIEPLNGLTKPDNKDIRKLKTTYNDLIASCLKAGHLFLNAYFKEEMKRTNFSKMVYWTSFAKGLREDFVSKLEKLEKDIT